MLLFIINVILKKVCRYCNPSSAGVAGAMYSTFLSRITRVVCKIRFSMNFHNERHVYWH
jgi:hypothetical protein